MATILAHVLSRRIDELERELSVQKTAHAELKETLRLTTTSCYELARQVQAVVFENRRLEEKLQYHYHTYNMQPTATVFPPPPPPYYVAAAPPRGAQPRAPAPGLYPRGPAPQGSYPKETIFNNQ